MRILACVPTYNERENMEPLARGLFGLNIPGLEVLIADDDSLDQTAAEVERLRGFYPALHLLKRSAPYGRGAAGREAFLYALDRGFDAVVEMDADLSHDPAHVPALLEALKNCDLAIGSRAAEGGKDAERSLIRRWITKAANAYAGRLLRIRVQDVNSGYRAWSRKALEAISPRSLKARGPAVVHEALFRACRAGLRVAEVPIRFKERKLGKSKLNLVRLISGYFWIFRLALFG